MIASFNAAARWGANTLRMSYGDTNAANCLHAGIVSAAELESVASPDGSPVCYTFVRSPRFSLL